MAGQTEENSIKILVLDIEISPTLATVWGLWGQNIGINQIIGNSEVLCWAARWVGEETVEFSSIHSTTKRRMLRKIYNLLEKADAVVTYNGKSFDLKILNKEFALLGWGRPAPYKNIDMLQVVRSQFRFTSNKLNYVAAQFKLGTKTKHAGHELWLHCMNPRSTEYESSWETMSTYNKQDVVLLEKLYQRCKGWIPNHPSYSAFENKHVCPNCGGNHLQSRGKVSSAALSYRRWWCKDCFAWSRSKVADKADRRNQLVGVK